jgi:ribosomal protein S18 acetylase RimI-like enzyme
MGNFTDDMFCLQEAKDRLLIAAKVGGKVVGVAKAPGDFPYISDVAVAPNQGKRGIGRALVRACEAAVAAQVSLYFRIGN